MAEYGKIFKKLWRSRRFLGMSEDAHRLLLYCFSGPESNSAGIYELKLNHLALDWNWTPKRLNKALYELLKNGYVEYDNENELVYVRDWFSGDPAAHSIQNENQLKKIFADISNNPRSYLHQKLINEIAEGVNGIPDRYLQPFVEQLGKRLPKRSRNIVTESVSETESEAITETESEHVKIMSPDKPAPNYDKICLIISHLNQVTGRTKENEKFSPDTEQTKKNINARLAEGYTIEDFFHVHIVKTEDWMNTDMEKFLNPSTLYRKSKFPMYKAQRMKSNVSKLSDTNRHNLELMARLTKNGIPEVHRDSNEARNKLPETT